MRTIAAMALRRDLTAGPELRLMPDRNHAKVVKVVSVGMGFVCLAAFAAARPGQAPRTRIKAKETEVSYTEEEAACRQCHQEEVDGFVHSQMGRSMRLPAQEPEGAVDLPGTTIRTYSDRLGTWQTLEKNSSVEKFHVDYVIGSGTHANGYIVSLANHLFQSPVAWYRGRAAYGLAPGYEDESDPDFTRPIEPGCLSCHAGSFTTVPGTWNEYAAKPFSHLAIECSRCHGPVEAHLEGPGASNIVNPANLDPEARDSVCEQCHLKGVARVLNPGKSFTDFVPGEPLEKTFTIYVYSTPAGTAPPFKVISHSEELAMSLCKRASGSQLWCGTCHDPHHEPGDPLSYYRARCLSCHANTHFAASHPSKSSNCIGCHMPKRETNDGGHTVFTDHRIQRRAQDMIAGEPSGIVPWRNPPAELAERDLGIATVEAGIDRKSWPEIVKGYRVLTEVQRQFPQDSKMFDTMGNALFIGRQYGEAADAFELAVRFNPGSSPEETSLASAYAALGQDDLAESHCEKAVALDPLNLSANELLISLYQKDGEPEKAQLLRHKVAGLLH
jgi:hypothetical protein